MLDAADSQDDRLALRRARRWRRRARIAGPLLAMPVMLGLLVLSVDLIEYRSTGKPARSDARPSAAAPAPPAPPSRSQPALGHAPEAALSVSVVELPPSQEHVAPAAEGLSAWPGELSDAARP